MNLLSLYLIITIFMGNPQGETSSRPWGLHYIGLLPPPLQASPNSAIIIRRLMKNLNKKGVKRMLPACCLPPGRREGVTLLAATENMRITKKKRISTEPKKQNTPTKEPSSGGY
jgi:hypothetical protein